MKISIYIALSTNGYISNTRNVADWLSPEYGNGLYSFCQEKGAVIMGKTTYNILAPNYLPLKSDGTTVVLTSDPKATSTNPTVVFTKDTAHEIVQMLERRGHKEAVIIGGARAMSMFVDAGLVNDIYYVLEPVVFGNGLRLLNESNLELKLKLVEFDKLNDNTIRLHYEIQK